MKSILFVIFIGCLIPGFGQTDTIKLNFLYGSKPAKGYKESESRLFGGLKGGHVNIEANGKVLDFMPGDCPLFPKNKNPTGGFRINNNVYWDTSGDKWTTILIPVTAAQMNRLDSLFNTYRQATPFDYAVFGMRCASASYYVLSKLGLFEEISNRKNVTKHFYPKLLRKYMLRWASKHDYPVIKYKGKNTRKWEKDSGFF
jgi:hypothetical protein